MIDLSEKLKQGRLAALHVAVWGVVLTIFVSAAVGFFFAEESEPLLRRSYFAVAAVGFAFTGWIVYRILTQDITEHHYRERKKLELDEERNNAEIEEAQAKAALWRAKERAIYTPLPGRSAPALPERAERAIYNNGERVNDSAPAPASEEIIEEEPLAPARAVGQWTFIPRDEPASDEAPARVARGQTVITESEHAYGLRIARLASEIYALCRDVNPPTQGAIMERIPLTAGGLLRSHDDITRALDALSTRGLIEPSRGQGIKRYWLDDRGERLPPSPKYKRGAVTSNVRVSRS